MILGVGNATLDLISEVEGFPTEDSEVRAVARHLVRGGNCANTLAVLRRLGQPCAWAGCLAGDRDSRAILADLEHRGIDCSPALRLPGGMTPLSCITRNRHNGSRTIVHYRDLPEYPASAFADLDLSAYRWLHFEGRNVEPLEQMLRDASQRAAGTPRSLEVEKARPGIETLLPLADVVLFSRDYAHTRGADSPQALLAQIEQRPGQICFVTWGAQGAVVRDVDGKVIEREAVAPAAVVDTLGAGDTFNAAVIDALLRGSNAGEALTAAVTLAGRKCTLHGFDEL